MSPAAVVSDAIRVSISSGKSQGPVVSDEKTDGCKTTNISLLPWAEKMPQSRGTVFPRHLKKKTGRTNNKLPAHTKKNKKTQYSTVTITDVLTKKKYNRKKYSRSAKKTESITKTRIYNFDPLKPHFYIVNLGFTGVYIFFLLKNIDCGYSLEPPRRGGSNEYPQSMFWAEIWKISEVFIWNFSVFGGEIFYIFA